MKVNDTFEGNKVPRSTKWLYSSGTIARDAAYTLVSLFFLTYVQFCAPLGYTNIVDPAIRDTGLYTTQMLVISAIVIICRIWDGFNDPIMGWVVEKCHFKTGKYKPWILIGGLTNAVVLFLMFFLQPVGWAYVGCFAVFYLLWDFTFTMNDIGYWSMLPSLSSDEKERNQITTLVSVFASVGAFAAGGIIPLVAAGNATKSYALVAGIIAIIFAISQMILFFFCKEHKRDESQEKVSEDTKFTDMFRILKTNSQVRISTIVILIYYLGSCILNAFGLNYFYFMYGYKNGGSIQFIFTVVYAAGTIIAQILFPVLLKKFTRNQLFLISFSLLAIGYTAFFFYDFPIDALRTSTWLGSIGDILCLCVLGAIIFSGQGLFYLILLVMMTNTIEYNQWKDNERRESLIFAMRPLTAKIASALQAGVVAMTLSMSLLYNTSNSISDIELNKGLSIGQFATDATVSSDFLTKYGITGVTTVGGLDSSQLTLYAQWLVDTNVITGIESWQLIVLKAMMTLLPLILFVVAYLLIKFLYFIDEKKYKQMVLEIEERNKPDYNPNVIVGDPKVHQELLEYKAREKKCKKRIETSE